jgi:hypothetical protein
MIEIFVSIMAVVAMVKIASADDQSPWLWGAATVALCVACIQLIPMPFLRIGIAFGLAFIGMIAYKVAADR